MLEEQTDKHKASLTHKKPSFLPSRPACINLLSHLKSVYSLYNFIGFEIRPTLQILTLFPILPKKWKKCVLKITHPPRNFWLKDRKHRIFNNATERPQNSVQKSRKSELCGRTPLLPYFNLVATLFCYLMIHKGVSTCFTVSLYYGRRSGRSLQPPQYSEDKGITLVWHAILSDDN